MHFYDYWSPGEDIEDNVCSVAAKSLIENGFEVIPLQHGTKKPPNYINSVAKLRQHPIHLNNIDFYFREGEEIAIMLRRNMEVIDVDSKNKEGLSEEFLKALKSGWEELYDKLVISKTPTGGLHILYFSDVIGGQVVLAQVNSSPNPKTIVERLNESHKNYIKCAPSNGYEFLKGNPMEMPRLSADERNWLCALAASFNKVSVPEVKKRESIREDSPWNVFNSGKDWQYIQSELTDRGWKMLMELDDKIVVKMPGGKQHSGVIWKDTNTLYIYTTNSEFTPEKQYSPFGVYCHYYHDGDVGAACRSLADQGYGKNVFDEGQFWKKEKTKIAVKYTDLLNWLHNVGYRIHKGSIVKVTDNIVSIIEERNLRAAFLNEVEPEMIDYFYEKVGTIFSENGGIMSMLWELDDNFLRDTPEATWLFFRNYAVKITKEDILPLQYREVSGYIWADSIIDRNFYNNDYNECDADKFTRILGGDKFEDLKKLIGYTVSRYKDPVNPRAVIIIEDIDAEDEGESQGGSGKGLLFSFVKQFRKVAEFDGKNFKPQDNFLYQNVEPDTNIIFIDDVERNFKFSCLFSILTNSLLINKKNKPQVIIPFKDSPKIFITSNYSVGALDISSQRRKYEFAVVKHFGQDLEPIDEFGHKFFEDWDSKEWLRFDNFITHCCQIYLSESDKKHIGNVTHNSTERSLISNTNREFVEYMDGQLDCAFFDFAPHIVKNYNGEMNGVYVTNGVNYDEWSVNRENPEYYMAISKDRFIADMRTKLNFQKLTAASLTRWFKKWAEVRGVEINAHFKRGCNSERSYRIVNFVPTFVKQKVGISDENSQKSGNGQTQSGHEWLPF